MQVNPEDSPPDIYVTWSNPRMTDFENDQETGVTIPWQTLKNEVKIEVYDNSLGNRVQDRFLSLKYW